MSEKLKEVLHGRVKPETEEPEDLGKCASRPVTKYVPAFHVKMLHEVRSFDYSHMGLKRYTSTGFVIEVHEPLGWRLAVEGRNLWAIFNYLCAHRLEWIAPIDRDFEDEKLPVITKITIEPIGEDK